MVDVMRRYVVRRVLGALAVAATFALLGWVSGVMPADANAQGPSWAPGPLDDPAELPGVVVVLGHCDPGEVHDDEASDPETDPCVPEPEPEPEGDCDEWAGLEPRHDGEDGCELVVRPADDTYRVAVLAAALILLTTTAGAMGVVRR